MSARESIDQLLELARRLGFNPVIIQRPTNTVGQLITIQLGVINCESMSEQVAFAEMAKNHGFRPEDYDTRFTFVGVKYSLVGFTTRHGYSACILRCSDNRLYEMASASVKQIIEKG